MDPFININDNRLTINHGMVIKNVDSIFVITQ